MCVCVCWCMTSAVLTGPVYGEHRAHVYVTQTLHNPHPDAGCWLRVNTAKQGAQQQGKTVLLTACRQNILVGLSYQHNCTHTVFIQMQDNPSLGQPPKINCLLRKNILLLIPYT
jgi:hypothetical protein